MLRTIKSKKQYFISGNRLAKANRIFVEKITMIYANRPVLIICDIYSKIKAR